MDSNAVSSVVFHALKTGTLFRDSDTFRLALLQIPGNESRKSIPGEIQKKLTEKNSGRKYLKNLIDKEKPLPYNKYCRYKSARNMAE